MKHMLEGAEESARKRLDTKDSRTLTPLHAYNNPSFPKAGFVPMLTPEEHRLLIAYNGCFKCRVFFAGHRSSDCPDGFPSGNGYVTLTTAQTKHERHGSNTPMSSAANKFRSVAAVTDTSSTSLFDAEDNTEVRDAINAILPLTSAILAVLEDSGSDENTQDSDEVSPWSVPHLFWAASVMGIKEFPSIVDTMFDSGLHLVLIKPETVINLGLSTKKLKKPVTVTVALDEKKKKKIELYDYVLLKLSTTDHSWTSKTV